MQRISLGIMKTEKYWFYGLLLVCSVLFFSCLPHTPDTFSSFIGVEFNDRLHSLDRGNGDTLIIGTEDGKLIFYNTVNGENHQVDVGADQVYFAHPITLPDSIQGVFVGVRNEGLKLLCGDKVLTTYTYGSKGRHYSVYRVIRDGNYLYCSTSNGLAKFSLVARDSLVPCHPIVEGHPDSVSKDYKVSAMVLWKQKIVFAKEDSLFFFDMKENRVERKSAMGEKILNLHEFNNQLMIIRENSIIIYGGARYPNPYKVHSCCKVDNPKGGDNDGYVSYQYLLLANNGFLMGDELESLNPYHLTLDRERYIATANIIVKNDFVYFICGSTLCKIPRHPAKGKRAITALARQDNSSLLAISNDNVVYKMNDAGEWEEQFVMSGEKERKVSQAIYTRNHLCLFADNDIYFKVGEKGEWKFTDRYSDFKNVKINRIYYDGENLFFAWRSGYGYGVVNKDGMIENIRTDKTIISVQCFARSPKYSDNLFIGTLNDGCIIRDIKKRTNVDTLFRDKITNIIDIAVTDTNIFVLTPACLYRAHLNDHQICDTVNVRNSHIGRIHCLGDSVIIGVSKMGGIYKFQQSNLRSGGTAYHTDILFYPDAIDIDTRGNTLIAGTNIGIVTLDLKNNTLTSHKINVGWLERLSNYFRSHSNKIVNGFIIALTVFILLLVLLSAWVIVLRKKTRNAALSKYKEGLKTLLDRKYPELLKQQWEIGGESFTEAVANSETFSEYQEKRKQMIENFQNLSPEKSDFKNQFDDCEKDLTQQLRPLMMLMDAFALREWCLRHEDELLEGNQDAYSVFRDQTDALVTNHIQKIVTIATKRENETCEIFLKICACSLLINDEKKDEMEQLLMPSVLHKLLWNKGDLYSQNFSQMKRQLKNDFENLNKGELEMRCDDEKLKNALKIFLNYEFPKRRSK